MGNLIDGLQAEYARPVRGRLDLQGSGRAQPMSQALFLADVLPTAYEVGVLNGMDRLD